MCVDFVERLVADHPRLRAIFDEHVSDNFGEVLPHLFFGDLTRYVVSRFSEVAPGIDQLLETERELRALLSDLEHAYASRDEELRDLISGSFLENLPRPGEEASKLRAWLGPELSAQVRVIG